MQALSLTPRSRFARLAIHGSIALASFLLVSSWIGERLLWSDVLGTRAKVVAFTETKDDYDAIYIGSSRTFRSFRPEIIDPIIRNEGVPFRSFNLGMAGMGSFEADVLLDEVLAMEPARLKWVFVEAPVWETHPLGESYKISERGVRWHTAAVTAGVLRSIWLEDVSVSAKLRLVWLHVRQMTMRVTSFAIGPSVWRSVCASDSVELKALAKRYLASRGYVGLESTEVPGIRFRRKTFLNQKEKYLADVKAVAGPPATEPYSESYNIDALDRQRNRFRQTNIKLAYVVLPVTDPGTLFVDLEADGLLPTLFYYKDPSRYPDLYAFSSQFDVMHLSASGSAHFSRLFARDVVEAMNNGWGR